MHADDFETQYTADLAATRKRIDTIRAACTRLIKELREGTDDYEVDRPTGYDMQLVELIKSHYDY